MRRTELWWGARGTGWLVQAVVLALTLASASAWGAPGPATNDEYALMVLANHLRADPAGYGLINPPAPPLAWSDDLAAAARYHSDDMAAHPGCFSHKSCNGQSFERRLATFYPGYSYIAENVTAASSLPEMIHLAFVEPYGGHTATLLSPLFAEFGAGLGSSPSTGTMTTEDFGLRDYVVPPPIPAGCVLPRVFTSSLPRKLLVNFYDASGRAPRAVRAVVGGSCIDLPLVAGEPDHGTYGLTRNVSGSGCVPLVFEAVRADGVVYRWPQTGSVLIGVGSNAASCPERGTQVPASTCDGDPPPTSPPPPGDPSAPTLDGVKGSVRPKAADPATGRVQLAAKFDPPSDFDPTSAGVQLAMSYGAGEQWSASLPRLCSGAPCLKPNKRGNVYSASYAGGRRLTVTRTASGVWRLRLVAPAEEIGTPSAGPVGVTFAAGGSTFEGQADGTMRGKMLSLK